MATVIHPIIPQHRHDCASCIFLGHGLRDHGYGGLQLGTPPDQGMGADLYLTHDRDAILVRHGSNPDQYGFYPLSIARMYVAQTMDGGDPLMYTNLAIALGIIAARKMEVRS